MRWDAEVCEECGNDDASDGLSGCMDCVTSQPERQWVRGLQRPAVLFDEAPVTVPLTFISPADVELRQVSASMVASLQPRMSKAKWRPAPGRKLAYVVTLGKTLVGLLFFASPVINLQARDSFLGLAGDPTKRGRALRHVMDLSVCVAAQPIAWHWNLGKLLALLACTIGDDFKSRYGDELRWVTTTSLWGRGSQYNRVFRYLGLTKGHGHEHIDDATYLGMLEWMRDNGHEVPSCRFGSGSNPRMRRIAAYRKASGDRRVVLKHGLRRGIYIHEVIDGSKRREIVDLWFRRWGLPRYERTRSLPPPYVDGLSSKPHQLEATA